MPALRPSSLLSIYGRSHQFPAHEARVRWWSYPLTMYHDDGTIIWVSTGICFFVMVLGMEPRACMLGRHSATELHLQPLVLHFDGI
jgi:hypothetical protein